MEITPEVIDRIASVLRDKLSSCIGDKQPSVTWTIGEHEWIEDGQVRRTPDGSLRILIDIPPDRLAVAPVKSRIGD